MNVHACTMTIDRQTENSTFCHNVALRGLATAAP